jgi:hypothetical protein
MMNAIIGNKIIWAAKPVITAFGFRKVSVKSSNLRLIPIPNMMYAMAIGIKM